MQKSKQLRIIENFILVFMALGFRLPVAFSMLNGHINKVPYAQV
jgi:hypothetical protein